jgi:hypothetical protein
VTVTESRCPGALTTICLRVAVAGRERADLTRAVVRVLRVWVPEMDELRTLAKINVASDAPTRCRNTLLTVARWPMAVSTATMATAEEALTSWWLIRNQHLSRNLSTS